MQTVYGGVGKAKKEHPLGVLFCLVQLANAVELQGHGALLVSGIVLVQNALLDALVHDLDSNLVSALGLGAIAFLGSDLKLLHGGLQSGLVSLVASVAHLGDQHALLSRLDIRQTKHLLRC